jgi:hypothetical protein
MFDLCLVTGDARLAALGEAAGIERVLIDLETRGKAERQAGEGLFLSTHRPEAVPEVRAALRQGQLAVRVNPLWEETQREVDAAIAAGADVLMLPLAETAEQARAFVAAVSGRARVWLLVETRGALRQLDGLLGIAGVDEVHVGLNDMRLSLGMELLFDVLCAGVVDQVAGAAARTGVRFGFGGVASPRTRGLPVEPARIIGEQVRLRSRCAWLGRSFRHPFERAPAMALLRAEVRAIRECAERWESASASDHARNRRALLAELEAWRAARKATTE